MAAYPCLLRPEEFDTCPFSAPSVSAWRAVAVAVTQPNLPIPRSSAIFACVMGGASIVQAVIRHFYLVGPREKWRAFLPNWMAMAISFVVPQTYYVCLDLFFVHVHQSLTSFSGYRSSNWRHHITLLGQEMAEELRRLLLCRSCWYDCW